MATPQQKNSTNIQALSRAQIQLCIIPVEICLATKTTHTETIPWPNSNHDASARAALSETIPWNSNHDPSTRSSQLDTNQWNNNNNNHHHESSARAAHSEAIPWNNNNNNHHDPSVRTWNHSPPVQTQLQQQQHPPPSVFLPTSTHHPSDGSLFQQTPSSRHSDSDVVMARHFDSNDPTKTSASSDQEILARQYGYPGLNVHRFNPNFHYYDRTAYPRYPFAQAPRYGPGYRKDKYGHGYRYSCKQGDDCDKVQAANQFPAIQPPHSLPPPSQHLGNHFPDLPPPPMPPYSRYESQFPARYPDPSYSSPSSSFYPGRYVHEQDQKH